jgi:hypothetical protein
MLTLMQQAQCREVWAVKVLEKEGRAVQGED